MDKTSFEGKTALVTGAASGMGRSTARLLAQRGARVLVCDIVEDGAAAVAAEIGDAARSFAVDVSDPAACEAMVDAAVDAFGRLDVAVNNAGTKPQFAPLHEMSVDEYRRVMSVNCDSLFYCMRAQIKQMLEQGGGAIVNTASSSSIKPMPGIAQYTAAKHGALGLTRNAAAEYGDRNIRVNCVCPGFTETGMTTMAEEDRQPFAASIHMIPRMGQPEEIAEVICFLASDAASFCTGGWYAVDAGQTAK